MTLLRSAGILILATLLAGCPALPRAVPPISDGTPAEVAFAARQARLGDVTDWTLGGRSAISAHGRGWNGAVHWDQNGETMDLRFIAPLGAGTLRVTGDADLVRIQGSDGTDLISTEPEVDLERFLGVRIPLAAMRWWALGIPVPGAAAAGLQLDEAGRATSMVQSGWTVTYPRYSEYEGVVIPGIVVVENPTTRVRLIIDRWTAHD